MSGCVRPPACVCARTRVGVRLCACARYVCASMRTCLLECASSRSPHASTLRLHAARPDLSRRVRHMRGPPTASSHVCVCACGYVRACVRARMRRVCMRACVRPPVCVSISTCACARVHVLHRAHVHVRAHCTGACVRVHWTGVSVHMCTAQVHACVCTSCTGACVRMHCTGGCVRMHCTGSRCASTWSETHKA